MDTCHSVAFCGNEWCHWCRYTNLGEMHGLMLCFLYVLGAPVSYISRSCPPPPTSGVGGKTGVRGER